MNLTAGTPLQNGKYIVSHPLGQRQWGATFKATLSRSQQPIVLKTMHPPMHVDHAALKQRFLEEAKRFSQCQHPGLVRVMDVFEESGLPFAAMDYVEGQSLAERVKSHGALPEDRAIQYIRQVGSALSVIHRHNQVHRDVKPENLIRPKGANFVVLVDFGIAQYARLALPHELQNLVQGNYEAIEQSQPSALLTPATDIYALAATLYFLVTGQTPIAAVQRNHTLLPSPRQLQPNLSAAMEYAILSGMAMNPAERPQTIAAWFALLPDSNPLPAVHEFPSSVGQAMAATHLPQPTQTTNGAGRPTAPPINTVSSTRPAVPPPPPRPLPSHAASKSRLPKALAMTAAIAIAAGVGLGLALRLSAVSGIGPMFFQTKQNFPPVDNWPLQADPVNASPSLTPLPEPPPIRSQLTPIRPLRVQTTPSPSPTPRVPAPAPAATIQPAPSLSPVPREPVIPPSPLPTPIPANTLPPRATPSVPAPLPSQSP